MIKKKNHYHLKKSKSPKNEIYSNLESNKKERNQISFKL